MEEVPGDSYASILSPAFLVPKTDGTRRFVIDYSKSNALCAPCALPVRLMEPLLEKLARCKVKSKMDLQSGYWQVKLSEESKQLTAFILPDKTIFRWKVLPMGSAVSAGVFQTYMSRHLRKFKLSSEVQKLLKNGSILEVLGGRLPHGQSYLLRTFWSFSDFGSSIARKII